MTGDAFTWVGGEGFSYVGAVIHQGGGLEVETMRAPVGTRWLQNLMLVAGAAVILAAACTPPPYPTEDRIDLWTESFERVTVPTPVGPFAQFSGTIENSADSSSIDLSWIGSQAFVNYTWEFWCTGPQVATDEGLACPAAGTYVRTEDRYSFPWGQQQWVLEDVLGTLTTSGPGGAVTALFDGTYYGSSGLDGVGTHPLVLHTYDGRA